MDDEDYVPNTEEVRQWVRDSGWDGAVDAFDRWLESAPGVRLIATERERQVNEEGYDAEHDKGHAPEMIRAAKEYAEEAHFQVKYGPVEPKVGRPWYDEDTGATGWPWHSSYGKPTGEPVKDLTKAGAIIAAAIDSLLLEGATDEPEESGCVLDDLPDGSWIKDTVSRREWAKYQSLWYVKYGDTGIDTRETGLTSAELPNSNYVITHRGNDD
jgi:hypothetical protein